MNTNQLTKYEVSGGLGRLAQYPCSLVIEAETEGKALAKASTEIRRILSAQLGEGNPMLNKTIAITSIAKI
jgi:hypothetical protein